MIHVETRSFPTDGLGRTTDWKTSYRSIARMTKPIAASSIGGMARNC